MKIRTLTWIFALGISRIALSDAPLPREPLARELGESAVSGCEEVVEHAVSLGINYRTLVDGCLQDADPLRKKKAISLMLWISAFGGVDGAVAEGHAAVLGFLVKRIGDEAFSKLVEGAPKVMREATLGLVKFDFGVGENPEEDATEDKRKTLQEYAKTFRALAAPEQMPPK